MSDGNPKPSSKWVVCSNVTPFQVHEASNYSLVVANETPETIQQVYRSGYTSHFFPKTVNNCLQVYWTNRPLGENFLNLIENF